MGFLWFKSDDREKSVVKAQQVVLDFLDVHKDKNILIPGSEDKVFNGFQKKYDYVWTTPSTVSVLDRNENYETRLDGYVIAGPVFVDKTRFAGDSWSDSLGRFVTDALLPVHEQSKYVSDIDQAFKNCRPIADIANENPQTAELIYKKIKELHQSPRVEERRAADILGVYFELPGFMEKEDFLYVNKGQGKPSDIVLLCDDDYYNENCSEWNRYYNAAEEGMRKLLDDPRGDKMEKLAKRVDELSQENTALRNEITQLRAKLDELEPHGDEQTQKNVLSKLRGAVDTENNIQSTKVPEESINAEISLTMNQKTN